MTNQDKLFVQLACELLAESEHDATDRLWLANTLRQATHEFIDTLRRRRAMRPTCLHASEGLCVSCWEQREPSTLEKDLEEFPF
jgi:hypothetical protein